MVVAMLTEVVQIYEKGVGSDWYGMFSNELVF